MSFENEYDRTSYWKYYTPSIEIKDFNVLIDGKQIELENPDLKKQINFIGKLEDDRTTMFFIIEKSGETTFNFSENSVSVI